MTTRMSKDELWDVGKNCFRNRYIQTIAFIDPEGEVALDLYGDAAKLNFPEKLNEYLCIANDTKEACLIRT